MNFEGTHSAKRVRLSGKEQYNEVSSISMYYEPPLQTLSLDEFERFPIERLRVMSVIEHAMSRGMHGVELEKKLDSTLKKMQSFMRCNSPEDVRRDNISHWVLRLAFSKAEDLRRRFLSFESFLFKYRFQRQTKEQIQNFMRGNSDLKGYTPIEQSERDLYQDHLQSMFMANNKNLFFNNPTADPRRMFQSAKWYKVDWTDVTDLVAKRKVFVTKGSAYVPHSDLVTILHSRFRSNLSLKLATGSKGLPLVTEDERIRLVLKTLQNAYLGPDYSNGQCFDKKSFSKDVIDSVALRSFPLCMRQLHGKLKHSHHLQYHGRVQFRLFLKGCGLTLADSLAYFQQEFCKKNGMTPGEFMKKYSYNIRHAYGQEGKRKDYTPYNCMKIIMGTPPAAGQAHGCPFKTYDSFQLKNVLQRQKEKKLSQVDIDFITEAVAKKEYQVACRRHFEKSHPKAMTENVGNHPNAWYEESSKFYKSASEAATAPTAIADTPADNATTTTEVAAS